MRSSPLALGGSEHCDDDSVDFTSEGDVPPVSPADKGNVRLCESRENETSFCRVDGLELPD